MMICIERTDGGVSIMQLVGKPDLAEVIRKWEEAAKAAGRNYVCASWHEVSFGDIPPDRTYRDAWQTKDKKLSINLDKAKEVHRRNLRVEAFKASLRGEAEEARRLSVLSSVPEISDASSLDDLKAVK